MSVVADELTLVVKSDVSGAISGLDRVEGKAQGVGGRLASGAAKWGARIGAVGIAAGVAGAVASSKMAMGFESAMAQIEANVGTTGEDLDTLKTAALEMGKEFGVSAEEAAGGLFFLQSAGLSVNDSIEALQVSSKMAAMGLGDMETIANGLTTAMTNWGISSAEAGDIVAKAVELGKSSPEEMTKILNQNAAAAAATGMEFNDLATVSAYLTRVTGDANKSGTQMQGMLAKLIKPSEQGKKMIKYLGIEFDEFAKAVAEDPVKAIKEFDKAFAGEGVKSNEWLGKVFEDVNAINGAMSLLNSDTAEMGDMFDSMNDRAGKVDAGFGVIADTAEFKLKSAFEGLKSAMIPIGATILTLVVPAIEWLAAKGQLLIEWIQGFTSGSSEMGSTVGGIFENIKTVAGAVIDFFVTNWPTIQETVTTVAEIVMGVVQGISDFMTPLLTDLGSFLKETFGEMVDWVRENWPEIKETIEIIMEKVKAIFETILPPIKTFIEITFTAIKEIIRAAMNIIKGIIELVMGIIRGDWSQVWEGIKKIADGVWDAIFGLIRLAVNSIKTYLGAVWGLIGENLTEAWNGIYESAKGIFTKIADTIKSAFKGAVNFVIDQINWLIRKLNSGSGFLNKIPGVNIPQIPEIPGLEAGGLVNTGGIYRVGENGPESVFLPAGASVTPRHSGDRGSGGGGETVVTVYIGEREFNDFVLDNSSLGQQLRSASRRGAY